MPLITSDQLRDISIQTVEGFLNDRIPLSEGLAKHASYYEMNSDQVQRAVEATNSIAYLKVLSLATDRTVEFPLCKYAEVMQELTLPKGIIEKSASVKIQGTETMVKSASDDSFVETPLNDAEKRVMFIKLAAKNERELQDLKEKEMFFIPDLLKAASDLKKDPEALEKLATVSNGTEFQKLTTLVFGVSKQHADTGLFKTAELIEARGITKMLKQAEELSAQIKHKEALAKQANLQKEAFLGAIGAGMGRLVGGVVSAPVKAVGRAVARTASNIGQHAALGATKVNNVVRSAVGAAPKPLPKISPKKFGIGALALTGAGVAFDASMYTPGKDASTGRSKNVWDTLQQEPK